LTNIPGSPAPTLTLGFSPCPNDTFIFDALANNKIDTGDLKFKIFMEDVETLNEWAFRDILDISKLSFNTFFRVNDRYALLHAGSALGKGCGPLLISKIPVILQDVTEMTIAIPGINTTANMLLDFAFPQATRRVPMHFSQIENAVMEGKTQLGVIIHENRFTYQSRGLVGVLDLGAYWEEKTQGPIPLAGITIKKKIPHEIRHAVDRLIRRSLEFAFAKYPELPDFVTSNAREMDPAVMRQHIDLYVNQYSLELGDAGLEAIHNLAHQASLTGILKSADLAITF
jgi:1,4-dihydroxy-6-naphthoate synthase